MEELIKEIEEINAKYSAIFEIPVKNIKTGEDDYILINELMVSGDKLVAQRIGFNESEEKSVKISKTEIEIEPGKSIDYHLEGIYQEIIEDIDNSPLYELV